MKPVSGIGLIAAALAAVALLGAKAPAPASDPVSVRVSPAPDQGGWIVEYAFAKPVRRVDLGPSRDGFRQSAWRVEGAEARLLTEEGRDFLVPARKGAKLRAVRAIVAPAPTRPKHYPAFSPIGAGAVLYTGDFWPYAANGERAPAIFTIAPGGQGEIAAFGKTRRGGVVSSPYDHPAFVYVGPHAAERSGPLLTVVDARAPRWVSDTVLDLAPRLFGFLSGAFGQELATAPDLFIAMGEDAADGHLRYDGDALPGQILITLSGGGWNEDSSAARMLLLAATAHEAAHLWQHAARPRSADVPDWIHEGAADAVAAEALVALGLWTPDEKRAEEERARGECGASLRGQSLASAERRGDWRASYACGRMLTLIAAKTRGETAIDFWRALQDRAAAQGGYDKPLLLSMIAEVRGAEFARAVDAFTFLAWAAPEKELQKLLAAAESPPAP